MRTDFERTCNKKLSELFNQATDEEKRKSLMALACGLIAILMEDYGIKTFSVPYKNNTFIVQMLPTEMKDELDKIIAALMQDKPNIH